LNECEVGCTGFQGVFLFIQQQMKTGFILHLDSLSVLDELTNEQAGILFKAIRDYNLGKEPELDFAMRMAFIPFKNQFERDLEKYNNTCERNRNNGSKGGRPKKPTETQKTQVVFEKPKKADNKNDNDNNKENIYRAFKHLSISIEEFNKLCIDYTKQQVDDILDQIENYSQNKKFSSLYLTAKNWLNRNQPKQTEGISPEELKAIKLGFLKPKQ
jgi:hypothetical protein